MRLDETARQRELDAQHLVDSVPEAVYQDIVQLATLICDVPIALVTLIDRDRQWFKAKIGLADNGTRRDEAFCNHAIANPDAMMEVPDAQADPRFVDNRLVTGEPNIRFYAGMPLVSPKGAAFGTVCVIDREPRQLDARQREGLEALTRLTMNLFESRHHRLRAEREELLAAALARPAPAAAAPPPTVVLFELMDAAGAARGRGERALERLLQGLDETLHARMAGDDSVDRVTGSTEFIAVLRGPDRERALDALRDAVAAFEGEHGLRILSGQAQAASAQESVLAVHLRAELALSQAKDEFAAAAA